MVLSSSENTSWHIGRDTDVGMTTCCQTGVRFPLCLLVLASLRGLVRHSVSISTGTGASIVKEKDIKTRRTFLGTLIEILTPISRP